jgi:hypothetical protein
MFRKMNMLILVLVIGLCVSLPAAEAFVININPGAGLSGNADALAAFNRGAAQWTKYFNDPITVTIDADLAALGPGIIGQASSVMLAGGYNTIRNQMVTDAAPYANNSIVASLPTAAQFSAYLPTGFGLTGNLAASKANLKALGFAGLDAAFGVTDATIQFSSNFSFDYNNKNGVDAGKMDFETVAAHEIGHALGFFSVVDVVDYYLPTPTRGNVSPNPLDLFRFRPSDNPTTPAQFTTNPRSLLTGAFGESNFSDTVNTYAFSTGYYTGDGHQASHWKADELTGNWIGLMDPTLDYGVSFNVAASDVRALDLTGYDLVTAPLPGTLWLLGSGLLGVLGWARRRE